MQVGYATRVADGRLVASVAERTAVAELMTPSESLVARPPRYLPRAGGNTLLLGQLLISPGEPDDDE